MNEGRTGEATIIMPPEGFKDANDVARDGDIEKWLGEFELYPSLNTASQKLRYGIPLPPKPKKERNS